MGCVPSSEEDARSKRIDAGLDKDRRADRTVVKMLMLGAGESGKSTLVKQMRLMYSSPYSNEERVSYREIVWANTLQSMQAVLDGNDVLQIAIPDTIKAEATYIVNLPNTAVELFHHGRESREGQHAREGMLDPTISEAIRRLWEAESTKEVVCQSNKFQLNDSAAYFFEHMDRISEQGYLPTDQDILRTRVRSVGIVEEQFNINRYTLRVVDVGGQRSERKKWIHCFENVAVLEFVAAISEYDQVLYEDESVNRLQEALVLFDSIACSRWFDRSTLVLLLNKVDLFAAKLPNSPLSHYFPDYTGGDTDLKAATAYMKHKFEELDRAKKSGSARSLYSHVTCATDTEQVQVIVGAMMTRILENLLVSAGLV